MRRRRPARRRRPPVHRQWRLPARGRRRRPPLGPRPEGGRAAAIPPRRRRRGVGGGGARRAVLQARLEGAHTAARLHAQRRHEERERYEAERVDMKSELEFLRERMVRAEEAEREMRLLMAQQTQTLQQATHALKAFTERPAL